jgi:hypothetical protein
MKRGLRSPLLSCLILLAQAACGHRSPEDRVRAAFEGCCAAVEAGDAARATEPLDPTFRGPEGMDRATARLFLMGTLRGQKVGVTVLRDEIRVDGPEATQVVDLVLTGRGQGLLPQETSRRTFLLRWREVGGQWRLLAMQSPEEP